MSHACGVLVRDLGPSELAWRLLGHARAQPLVFFQEHLVLPVLPPGGPVVSVSEAWGYKGPLIATTFSTAAKLAGFPGRAPRAHYLWDLEWLRVGPTDYRALAAVYRDGRLPVVCRSAGHAAAFERAWNRTPSGVVADADPAKILGCLA